MKYKKLDNSELTVSQICMGCMGFGDSKDGHHSWTLNEEESHKIIKSALEIGINFFDTAIAYQNGSSERYLGSAIKKYAKREDVIIATKFLPRTSEDIAKGVTGQQYIRDMVNKSLKNLDTDYIDLYIYHMWDYNTPLYDIMDGLNQMVLEGKVKYLGISNCYAWQISKANALAEKEGFSKFISIQGHYNLIFREEEREMIPFCKDQNISITPYSPLAGGRLSKPVGETSKRFLEDQYAKSKYDLTKEQDNIIIERVLELATKKNVTMTEISLAWLLSKGAIPVMGVTKLSHLEGIINTNNIQLTNKEISYLEEPYIPHKLVGVLAENRG